MVWLTFIHFVYKLLNPQILTKTKKVMEKNIWFFAYNPTFVYNTVCEGSYSAKSTKYITSDLFLSLFFFVIETVQTNNLFLYIILWRPNLRIWCQIVKKKNLMRKFWVLTCEENSVKNNIPNFRHNTLYIVYFLFFVIDFFKIFQKEFNLYGF